MNQLLQRLHDVDDDTERAALLEAASAEELAQLNAELTYHVLMAEAAAATAALDAFTASLERAADDAARLRLIAAARHDHGADWLSEWAFWRTATAEDWSKRWQNMVGGRGSF